MEYEWQLCWAIGMSNAKNYQLWNHRRRCAMNLGAANAPRELEFAAHFLAEDAKNYHIWAHRQVQHSHVNLNCMDSG
jgi:protein farnesyltransferase/geranylgeranyltransferase type-1 subunit alpha